MRNTLRRELLTMDINFYFVALVKRDQICYLQSGPFVSREDAETSFSATRNNQPASGSYTWQIVEAEMVGTIKGF